MTWSPQPRADAGRGWNANDASFHGSTRIRAIRLHSRKSRSRSPGALRPGRVCSSLLLAAALSGCATASEPEKKYRPVTAESAVGEKVAPEHENVTSTPPGRRIWSATRFASLYARAAPCT